MNRQNLDYLVNTKIVGFECIESHDLSNISDQYVFYLKKENSNDLIIFKLNAFKKNSHLDFNLEIEVDNNQIAKSTNESPHILTQLIGEEICGICIRDQGEKPRDLSIDLLGINNVEFPYFQIIFLIRIYDNNIYLSPTFNG